MSKFHFLLILLSVLTISCQDSFEQRIKEETEEYTQKNCPKYIEPGNVLDSLTYSISTRTITFWYTLSGEKECKQFTDTIKKYPEMVRANTLRSLNNDTKWNACKERGVNFRYVHRLSKTDEIFMDITLTPKDYK